MNVHRWRRLEGTDPAKVELVKKIQSLQKRLIAKTEEVRLIQTAVSVLSVHQLYFISFPTHYINFGISSPSQVIERDLQIQEKEKLFVQLKVSS